MRLVHSSLWLAVVLAAPASAKLKVMTTTTDLASIARAVGGDAVEVTAIASGDQDPHFIEARPSLMSGARNADLLVEVGMELEVGWEPLILQGARNPKIQAGQPGHLDASEGVRKLEVPTGTVDRSQGDVHPFGNPHYWLDPWNARVVSQEIADRLAQLSPQDAPAIRERAAAFRARLDAAMFGADLAKAAGGDALWRMADGDLPAALKAEAARRGGALPPLGGWAARLAPFRGAAVMTYHKSWPYLLDRFGLVTVGEIEPKPGIPPSPSHLLELIKAAQQAHAKAILVEPWYGNQAPDLVAGRTGAKVVSVTQSVETADGDYVEHFGKIVEALASALSG